MSVVKIGSTYGVLSKSNFLLLVGTLKECSSFKATHKGE